MTTPNTNPLTYNLYVQQIATMAVVDTTTVGGVVQGVDAAFNTLIPQMLNYAELRIQRDLDLLPLLTSRSYALNAGTNQIQLSVNDFVTVQTVQVTLNGATTTLLPATKEFIQTVWANPSAAGYPKNFAMVGGDLSTGGDTYNNILIGPYADVTYPVTIFGTIRAPSLNLSNTAPAASTATTFISTYIPDMLIMASMVYISAYQRNFGRMSDDPAMAQSYEGQYQALLRGATVEEYRKKFAADAWSSMSPSPPATPTR